ncbi:uncharacterized protein EV420DRAFT_1478298 [Desarmillaria tabescens]|uniref:Uncharacterized protein n=1 Tax=Armillaria tabescens TaxID=1929756 RepID=A0AA39T2T1_ARMTA|nr:uncharacterized protein EV420DRAFT_1478298 [Desarmillaria tabescens]KAK0460526.1 hypothetical protein EV420DRAFT_1478298 [Desarmillaria tabescens]
MALVPIDVGCRQHEYDMELDLGAASTSTDLVLSDHMGMSNTHQRKRHVVAGPNRQSHDEVNHTLPIEMLGALCYSQDQEHKKSNMIRLLKAQQDALSKELRKYQQYFPVPRMIYAGLDNDSQAAELKRQVSLLHSEREVMQKDIDKLLKQRAKDERLLTQQREIINQANQHQSINSNMLQGQKEALEKQNKFIAQMMSRMEALKAESTKTHEEMNHCSAELKALKMDNTKTCAHLAELEKAINSKDNEIVSLQGHLAAISASPSQSSTSGVASTPRNQAGTAPSATQSSLHTIPLPRKISTPRGTSHMPTKIQCQQVKVPISSWREALPAVDPPPSHTSQLVTTQEGAAAEPAVTDLTTLLPAETREQPSTQESATVGAGGMPSNINLGDPDQLIRYLASCLKRVVVSDLKESLETGQRTLAPKKMTERMEQQERMGKSNKNRLQTFIRRWWCKFYKVDSVEEFIVYEAQEQQTVLAFKDKQGPGPTEDDLILDFSHGFASSKWNRAIFMIMIPMIQEELKKELTLPAAGTTQLETGEEVVQHVAETGDHVHKTAALRSSKVRMKNGDMDLRTWQLFLKMLQMLGTNGMSSEEEVIKVVGGITETVYTVKVCIWQNGKVIEYLKDIDGASPQFTGKGSHPAHRDRETVPRMNEVVNAPQELPRALYDPEWLAELDEYEQGDLCISKDAFELLEKVVEAVDMPEHRELRQKERRRPPCWIGLSRGICTVYNTEHRLTMACYTCHHEEDTLYDWCTMPIIVGWWWWWQLQIEMTKLSTIISLGRIRQLSSSFIVDCMCTLHRCSTLVKSTLPTSAVWHHGPPLSCIQLHTSQKLAFPRILHHVALVDGDIYSTAGDAASHRFPPISSQEASVLNPNTSRYSDMRQFHQLSNEWPYMMLVPTSKPFYGPLFERLALDKKFLPVEGYKEVQEESIAKFWSLKSGVMNEWITLEGNMRALLCGNLGLIPNASAALSFTIVLMRWQEKSNTQFEWREKVLQRAKIHPQWLVDIEDSVVLDALVPRVSGVVHYATSEFLIFLPDIIRIFPDISIYINWGPELPVHVLNYLRPLEVPTVGKIKGLRSKYNATRGHIPGRKGTRVFYWDDVEGTLIHRAAGCKSYEWHWNRYGPKQRQYDSFHDEWDLCEELQPDDEPTYMSDDDDEGDKDVYVPLYDDDDDNDNHNEGIYSSSADLMHKAKQKRAQMRSQEVEMPSTIWYTIGLGSWLQAFQWLVHLALRRCIMYANIWAFYRMPR